MEQKFWGVTFPLYAGEQYLIDLIHDTRNLRTRFRNDGIKAMSPGISGGKQKIKFTNTRNRGRLCLFYQNETTI